MRAKYKISCAVAAILTACGGAAVAATPTSASSDSQSNASSSGVEQIIVTAQRRDQTVQKVPMTIQALSNTTLSQLNIKTLDNLIRYTPNVTFGNNGPGQGEIFMRGLSAGFRGNQSSGTIANFPNVALYLDEQSMQFPARNADIFLVDMNRVEVLEGPQGTLFGGGAEAGAVRYITNKPKLGVFEGNVEASGGATAGGAPNYGFNLTLNVPVVSDKVAVRAVVYDDHEGGYIDNVPSTFTRKDSDPGNYYLGITPTAGHCPDGGAPNSGGFCTLKNAPVGNNYKIAGADSNPLTYTGGRVSALFNVNNDWNVLITESLQHMDAQGISAEYPIGSDGQHLQPLQITAFSPSYNKDDLENTAWTVNGKIGPLKAVYTGGFTDRHISEQMDYSNYSRTGEGIYYACTGGATGFGSGAPTCYSPVTYWHDTIESTHLSNELRLSTPDDWRLRAIAGAYFESFRIHDVMNFDYKNIPSCTPANLTVALGGGAPCVANIAPAPGSTANDPSIRGDHTAFGEDTQRGYDQTAFFATVDYDLIPHVLTLTAGTRWYQYNEFEVGSQYGTDTDCLNVPNGCTADDVNINAAHDKATYSGFKSHFGLTWHVTPNTLAYFVYSEGFRPGGFNRSVKGVAQLNSSKSSAQYEKPNAYAPDSLTNYEIGVKTQLFDHRLLINLSAYYMNWNNVQFLFFNPTELGNTTFGVNGPNYTVKGVEAQFVARITHGLTVQGSATYNDDRQTNSPCLIDNISGTPAFGQCITQVFQNGVGTVPFQNPFGAPGSVPAFSPFFQGNIRGRYDWDIQNYHAFVSAGVSYTGDMYNQPGTYPSGVGVAVPNTTFLRYLQPGYATVDASIGISKDNWSVELYGQNLGNSHASTFTSSAQFIQSEVPLRPRVIGVKVGAHF